MDIPPEVEIQSSIRQGSVYYFHHESLSSPTPHYFIVINQEPVQDTIILLVCASSQVHKRLMWYSACPEETLVLVKPEEYPEFNVLTVIDCNNVFEITFEQLIKKRQQGLLQLKSPLDTKIVATIKRGVVASPLIEQRIKALIG